MSAPQERLEAARRAAETQGELGGIGRLGEKKLHAILKYYYEPDAARHEQPYLGYVADILSPAGVTEIQTRSFGKLRPKLERFLEAGPVCLVYPLPHRKWLRWIDPEIGEVSAPRKSPKIGQAAEACFELSMIQALLPHENLEIRLLLLDVEEYRYLNGWGNGGKRGSSRAERLPIAVAEEIILKQREDFLQLLPPDLPEVFTSAELAARNHLSPKRNQQLLSCLRKLELLRQVGKQGRAYLYQIPLGAAGDAQA